MHHYNDLIRIFNHCFSTSHNTRLIKGEDEPVYLPAHEQQSFHGIFFAHGFFSSALHECSHWLIAGPQRRELVDFGYWYAPDGRTPEQQAIFQSAEIKPQALEWILSKACGHPFRVSIDNLEAPPEDTLTFKQAIYNQVLNYCEQGLPARAQKFRTELCHFYKTELVLNQDNFKLDGLR